MCLLIQFQVCKLIAISLLKVSFDSWLLFGASEKLLTQRILGSVTKYKLLYVSNQARAMAKG